MSLTELLLFPKGAAENHIEEQVNAFLLNAKEWELLSEIRVDENTQTLDYRSVSIYRYYR